MSQNVLIEIKIVIRIHSIDLRGLIWGVLAFVLAT